MVPWTLMLLMGIYGAIMIREGDTKEFLAPFGADRSQKPAKSWSPASQLVANRRAWPAAVASKFSRRFNQTSHKSAPLGTRLYCPVGNEGAGSHRAVQDQKILLSSLRHPSWDASLPLLLDASRRKEGGQGDSWRGPKQNKTMQK